MRITDVETLVLRIPQVDTTRSDGTQDAFFVRVHTDEGITGIGEADTSPYLARTTVEMPSSHAVGRGLREILVVMRHAVPNALIPLVTVVGLQFGYILGGAVVIETIFTWPGVGLFTIQAILNRDYPVVQASVFILATAVVMINLIVDLLYVWLDPRIRIA